MGLHILHDLHIHIIQKELFTIIQSAWCAPFACDVATRGPASVVWKSGSHWAWFVASGAMILVAASAVSPSVLKLTYSLFLAGLRFPLLERCIDNRPCLQRTLQPPATCHVRTLYSCTHYFSIRNTLWWMDTSITRTCPACLPPCYCFSLVQSGQCNQICKHLQECLLRKWVITGISRWSAVTGSIMGM